MDYHPGLLPADLFNNRPPVVVVDGRRWPGVER